MPSFERGAYEPKSDDVRVFDEDEQDVDEEGSRLPLLIVIALLVLAAFGGVVWLAYSQGVQSGRADAPRMIVAEPGPVKEAAAGSQTVPHGLKIYQQPAPTEDDVSDNDNAPVPAANVASHVSLLAAAKPTPVAAKPVTSKRIEIAKVSKPVVAPKPAPVEKPKAAKSATLAPKPVEKAVLPPPAATAPAKPAKAATASGAYVLQIGSYKSQAIADAAWKTFKSKHSAASRYSENVLKADLGAKGVWYRLRIGSFADKSAAAAFCEKLKSEGGNCLVAK